MILLIYIDAFLSNILPIVNRWPANLCPVCLKDSIVVLQRTVKIKAIASTCTEAAAATESMVTMLLAAMPIPTSIVTSHSVVLVLVSKPVVKDSIVVLPHIDPINTVTICTTRTTMIKDTMAMVVLVVEPVTPSNGSLRSKPWPALAQRLQRRRR